MKKIQFALTAIFTFCATFVQAQSHDMMPIVVQSDKVLIGAEFVPRGLTLPSVLAVPAGQISTVPVGESTWDYIEVAGTLRFDRTRDTTLRVTTLIVLPGGSLDVGTESDPILPGHIVEIVFRNVPIDKAVDPHQWSHGLLNFGTQNRVGAPKTSRVTTVGDVLKGTTVVTLAEVPSGWRVGDELLFPDTEQQPHYFALVRPQREAAVYVAAISGTVVTLSKPLDFDHFQIRKPKAPGEVQGAVIVKPRVLNITRNIVLRSEGTQVPGHTANVGAAARWRIRSNMLSGIGRTTIAVIDSTNNHLGRYADHDHHACFGKTTTEACESVNNVYRGVPNGVPTVEGSISFSSKWGKVVHGTHDTIIDDNIAVDFPGAGFVTEDGYEVRNHFTHNTAVYTLAPRYYRADGVADIFPPTNITENHPGTEGTGFWMRGVKNFYDANEAWDCTVGMNLMNQAQLAGMYPSTPNGPLDIVFDALHNAQQQMAPPQFTDNLFVGNVIGLDLWALPPFDNLRTVAANNVAAALNAQISESHRPILKQPLFVNQYGDGYGINADGAYLEFLRVEGGYVGGFESGLPKAGAVSAVQFVGTVLQNITNLQFTANPFALQHDNVIHLPYENYPPRYIVLHDGAIWDGVSPQHSSALGFFAMSPTRGSQYLVKNWQGTGKDYRLFHNQSRAELPAWPSDVFGFDQFNPPEAGLTMGQSWDTYGIAFRGSAVSADRVVQLDGLINGFAEDGLVTTFGPPQGVLTFPTMHAPAVREYDEYLRFYGVVSGDPTLANGQMKVVIDGTTTLVVDQNTETGPLDGRRFTLTHTQYPQHMTPGTHEVRTWRFNMVGVVIPESERVWHYFFGEQAPPVDVCPNLEGVQVTVPAGMVLVNGQCIIAQPPPQTCQDPGATNVGGPLPCLFPPPPVDVCPNIPGVQPTVPAGMVLVDGQCVTTTPTEVWGAAPTLEQLKIDGVPQDRFRLCTTSTHCVELVIKP